MKKISNKIITVLILLCLVNNANSQQCLDFNQFVTDTTYTNTTTTFIISGDSIPIDASLASISVGPTVNGVSINGGDFKMLFSGNNQRVTIKLDSVAPSGFSVNGSSRQSLFSSFNVVLSGVNCIYDNLTKELVLTGVINEIIIGNGMLTYVSYIKDICLVSNLQQTCFDFNQYTDVQYQNLINSSSFGGVIEQQGDIKLINNIIDSSKQKIRIDPGLVYFQDSLKSFPFLFDVSDNTCPYKELEINGEVSLPEGRLLVDNDTIDFLGYNDSIYDSTTGNYYSGYATQYYYGTNYTVFIDNNWSIITIKGNFNTVSLGYPHFYLEGICLSDSCGIPCNINPTFRWNTGRNNNAQFHALDINNNYSYIWDFGDGNTATGHTNQHFYASPGTYYVCLTVINNLDNTCVDTYCDSVTVVRQAPVFTPDGDGVNDTFIVPCVGKIYNRNGVLVKTISSFNYAWDGKDDNGNLLPRGQYTVICDGDDSTTRITLVK